MTSPQLRSRNRRAQETLHLYAFRELFPSGYNLALTAHVRVRAVERLGVNQWEVPGWIKQQVQQDAILVASPRESDLRAIEPYERWLLPNIVLVVSWRNGIPHAITCYANEQDYAVPEKQAAASLSGTHYSIAKEVSMHNNIMATDRAVGQAISRLGQSNERQIAYRWLCREAGKAELVARDTKTGLELLRSESALLVMKHKRGMREVQECAPLKDRYLLAKFGQIIATPVTFPVFAKSPAEEMPAEVPSVFAAPVPDESTAVVVVSDTPEVAKEEPPVVAITPNSAHPLTKEEIQQQYEKMQYARCSRHAQKYPDDEAKAWLPKSAFSPGNMRWGTHSYCAECMREYSAERAEAKRVKDRAERAEATRLKQIEWEKEHPVAQTSTPTPPSMPTPEPEPEPEVEMEALETPLVERTITFNPAPEPTPAPTPAPAPTPVMETYRPPMSLTSGAVSTLEEYLHVADGSSITLFSASDRQGNPFSIVTLAPNSYRVLTTEGVGDEALTLSTLKLVLRFMLHQALTDVKGYLLS